MLILPIKRKWFDMILLGIKKEEYREISPYYITRFQNETISEWCNFSGAIKTHPQNIEIKFRNGYSNNSDSFCASCELTTGIGKKEWGAIPNKEYFILKIKYINYDSIYHKRFNMWKEINKANGLLSSKVAWDFYNAMDEEDK